MKFAVRTLVAGLPALALAACGGGTTGSGPRPATIQQIGNGQELSDVVFLLEQGNEKAARRKLTVMTKRDPSDIRSRALLDSLTADPVAMLGSHAFDYRIEPGDTLPSVAQRFLNDRLKFYLLARYNHIAVPASLRAGQTIRIPGEAPAPKPAPRARLEPPAPAPTKVPPKAVRAKPVPPKPTAAANPRRAAALRGSGLAALNKGQVGQAVSLLSQALSADPGNSLIQRDLDRARRIQSTVRARK